MTVKKRERRNMQKCYILLGKKKIFSWGAKRGLLQFPLRIITTSPVSAFLWLQTKISPMSHNNYLCKTSNTSEGNIGCVYRTSVLEIDPSDILLECVSPACYSPGTGRHAHHFPPRGVQELMDRDASEQVRWTLGRWWSRKHQESVFPPRQLPRQNITDVTISELWS